MIEVIKAKAEAVWAKVKSWALWVYDWITVLTASVVGALAFVPEFLDYISGADIAPFVSPENAGKVIAGVGIAKGISAAVRAHAAPKEA